MLQNPFLLALLTGTAGWAGEEFKEEIKCATIETIEINRVTMHLPFLLVDCVFIILIQWRHK
jgi:hypothetical protein